MDKVPFDQFHQDDPENSQKSQLKFCYKLNTQNEQQKKNYFSSELGREKNSFVEIEFNRKFKYLHTKKLK